MRRSARFWVSSLIAVALALIATIAVMRFRIEPLPTKEQMQVEEGRRHAQRLRDLPSCKNLQAIQPIRVEQVLILERIGGLALGSHSVSNELSPVPSADACPPAVAFRAEYLAEKDNDLPAVFVDVWQLPNQAWPLYFAKWSPNPGFLRDEDPSLVLTRVRKFHNTVVMDRQFRDPDESGRLWFFWLGGKNLVSVTFRTKAIEEDVLRQYLEKFPSSL